LAKINNINKSLINVIDDTLKSKNFEGAKVLGDNVTLVGNRTVTDSKATYFKGEIYTKENVCIGDLI